MYTALLAIHSLLRWLVIGTGLLAAVRGFGGMKGNAWTKSDDNAGRWFIIALDIQLLLGLMLYGVLSPITQIAFDDMGAAMRDPQVRFWAVEHLFGMVIGVALAHVGRVRIRRAVEDVRKHKLAAIFFTLALIAILASIPWPGMPAGRPLFRGL